MEPDATERSKMAFHELVRTPFATMGDCLSTHGTVEAGIRVVAVNEDVVLIC